MSSLLGPGNFGALANTTTAASPITLYDVTVDAAPCNAYSIVNLDATNWVWVSIPGIHKAQGIPILPGERLPLVKGFNGNELNKIVAWTTAPNVAYNGTAASGSVNICGGIERSI